jgi:hypothetical protein
MMSMRNAMLAVATGAGMLALSAASASAAVVCRGDVCWHTKTVYEYPADAGIVVHEDSWRAGPHITFREHEGRGYWHEGKWRTW